jgi:hypothetical protein
MLPGPADKPLTPVFLDESRTKLEHPQQQCYMWITEGIGPRASPASV